MAEQHFREIQLSGKQLVFLFMTSVAVAVAVFLLGVSVGRGLGPGAAPDTPEQVAEVLPPEDLPPPTEIGTEDLAYYDQLKDTETPAAESEPVSTTDSGTLAEPEPVAEPMVQAPETPTPTPAPVSAPEPPPAPSPKPVLVDGWSVQVNAFRSRANADRQAQELKEKGFAATVQSADGLHRVRVGPFADRTDANRIAARLRAEEGLRPSVTR